MTTLLILLFVCHYLADYTWLSTSWMLDAKRLGITKFPIFVHAFVHASLMLLVLLFYVEDLKLAVLFSFQLLTHFVIDVSKGQMNALFPSLQSPANKLHWVVFGLDQLLHAIVIILMAKYSFY